MAPVTAWAGHGGPMIRATCGFQGKASAPSGRGASQPLPRSLPQRGPGCFSSPAAACTAALGLTQQLPRRSRTAAPPAQQLPPVPVKGSLGEPRLWERGGLGNSHLAVHESPGAGLGLLCQQLVGTDDKRHAAQPTVPAGISSNALPRRAGGALPAQCSFGRHCSAAGIFKGI